ncbi:MAG: YfiR/HmsC family protein [Acidobacteriota bacterium]
MTDLRRQIALILVCAMLQCSVPGLLRAQTMDVPADIQVRLFSKLLAYERNLSLRSGTRLAIGILYQRSFKGSSVAKDDIMKALSSSVSTIGGIPFRIVPIELDDAADVASELRDHGIGLAYVAPLRAYDLSAILEASRKGKILTLTGVSTYSDQGVSVAIGMMNEHPQILINLSSAKAEGADFNSHFLKLVRIVQ